jgi:hypothetical protein
VAAAGAARRPTTTPRWTASTRSRWRCTWPRSPPARPSARSTPTTTGSDCYDRDQAPVTTSPRSAPPGRVPRRLPCRSPSPTRCTGIPRPRSGSWRASRGASRPAGTGGPRREYGAARHRLRRLPARAARRRLRRHLRGRQPRDARRQAARGGASRRSPRLHGRRRARVGVARSRRSPTRCSGALAVPGPSMVGASLVVHTRKPDDQSVRGVVDAHYADRLVLRDAAVPARQRRAARRRPRRRAAHQRLDLAGAPAARAEAA